MRDAPRLSLVNLKTINQKPKLLKTKIYNMFEITSKPKNLKPYNLTT